jgi:ribose 5-phosphate isomerase B
MLKPKIFLGTDHAGFMLKEKVKEFLNKEGFEVEDLGALEYDQQDDYPKYIFKAAETVAKSNGGRGIVFGASGQGEAIVANKVKGIRAALYYGGNPDIVKLSRTHNDSNVLSIGAKFVEEKDVLKQILVWLSTPFSGEERHKRRISQISKVEV